MADVAPAALRRRTLDPVTVDRLPHPITTEGRRTLSYGLPPGRETLAHLVADCWSGPWDHLAACVDDAPVPRAAWAATRLAPGQVVTLRAALAGGDSDPLAAILQIALLLTAVWLPHAGVLAGTAFEAGTLGGSLLSAGIMAAGGLVINALFPPDRPRLPQSSASDPVYSLRGAQNRARPYEPLLVVLGTHRVAPDLGAAPYTEIVGDDQYLHLLLHYGLGGPGDLAITDTRVGDTPLEDVLATDETLAKVWETSTGAAFATVAVHGNVDTVEGAALEGSPEPEEGSTAPRVIPWVTLTTSDDTTRIGIDITGQLFATSRRGEVVAHSVTVQVRYHPVGDAAAAVNREVRLEHDESAPYRTTIEIDSLAAGQYTVQVRRKTEPSDSDRVFDTLHWAALRSYQRDTADYTGQTRAALRLRASGRSQGSLQRVSSLVSRSVPVLTDAARGTWGAPAVTSNPAALLRWYALGVRIAGRLVFGVGLPTSRINGPSLAAWHQWCATQALGCNMVIDRAESHHEVLTAIARCGRASVTWEGGKLGVIYDQADKPATAWVGPQNIVQQSLTVLWNTEPAADEIVGEYHDEDQDWEMVSLRRRVGAGQPSRPVRVRLRGVTSATQAARTLNLQAAKQALHLRRIRWRMPAAGQFIARGDVVYLTHGLVSGGVTGRARSGTATDLVLSREITLTANDYLLVAMADGTLHTSRVSATTAGEYSTDRVTLAAPLPDVPGGHGGAAHDVLWRHYTSAAPPLKVRVVRKEPRVGQEFLFEAIDELPEYYAAVDSDLTSAALDPRRRDVWIVRLEVGETLIRLARGYAVEIDLLLITAGDWRGGVVRVSRDGGPPRTVARLLSHETRASWVEPVTGVLTITATPGTETDPVGSARTVTHTIRGLLAPPGPPTNFLIDQLPDGTRRFRWRAPEDVDYAGVEIRGYPDVAVGVSPPWDHEDHVALYDGPRLSPYDTHDPPSGSWTFLARSVDLGGRLSESAASIRADLGPPPGRDDVYVWSCPSAEDWPWTRNPSDPSDSQVNSVTEAGIKNFGKSGDHRNALEGLGAYTWADLSTWAAWKSWGAGSGTQAATTASYTTDVLDLLVDLPHFGLIWNESEAEVSGTVTLAARAGATESACLAAEWATYREGDDLSGQYVQLRWTLSGDGSTVLRLDHLCYSVLAPTSIEYLYDSDPTTWAVGTIPGTREAPLTQLAVCVDLDITVQYRRPTPQAPAKPVTALPMPVVLGKSTRRVEIGDSARTEPVVTVDFRGQEAQMLLDVRARGIKR